MFTWSAFFSCKTTMSQADEAVEPAHPFHQPSPAEDSRRLLEIEIERKEDRRYKRSNWIYVALVVGILALLLVAVVIGVGVGFGTPSVANRLPTDPYERAVALLTEFPLVDG